MRRPLRVTVARLLQYAAHLIYHRASQAQPDLSADIGRRGRHEVADSRRAAARWSSPLASCERSRLETTKTSCSVYRRCKRRDCVTTTLSCESQRYPSFDHDPLTLRQSQSSETCSTPRSSVFIQSRGCTVPGSHHTALQAVQRGDRAANRSQREARCALPSGVSLSTHESGYGELSTNRV